ncbi:hypothetical protein OQA88_12221 [Cercophora sp. LCS_1]
MATRTATRAGASGNPELFLIFFVTVNFAILAAVVVFVTILDWGVSQRNALQQQQQQEQQQEQQQQQSGTDMIEEDDKDAKEKSESDWDAVDKDEWKAYGNHF